MNHLQNAKYAIERAATAKKHESAMLSTQLAIANAMVALVERMDSLLDLHGIEIDKAHSIESKMSPMGDKLERRELVERTDSRRMQ